jgi:hypothetical protein
VLSGGELGAAYSGVKLGGDVGGGKHMSHFDGLDISFALEWVLLW